jgi:hypothetical protein
MDKYPPPKLTPDPVATQGAMLGDENPPLAINWVWADAGRHSRKHNNERIKRLLLIEGNCWHTLASEATLLGRFKAAISIYVCFEPKRNLAAFSRTPLRD